jgi:hypothetical protein
MTCVIRVGDGWPAAKELAMPEEKDKQLEDIQAEERTRGTKRPVKALSRERERQLRRLARLLENPKCDFNTYVETIREFGMQAEPEKYHQLIALWRKRRGNG